MRGFPIPEREADFAADPAELFFDLAFVFAFSRLVAHLVHHPDWVGVAEFALLFAMIWLPWTQFTWSANAVAGNTRPVRLVFLVATVTSVPMAGSVTTAFDDGGPVFAITLSVILAMALVTMLVGLADEPGVLASTLRYSVPNMVAMAVMVAGSFLDREARIVAWIAALGIVLYGTVRAGSSEWLVRPGHFSERHGLILIVALGEVIVALGTPVAGALEEGAGLSIETVAALVAAGAFAGLLWWAHFDRPAPALETRHEATDGVEAGRYARDIYTYAHFPLIAGVILSTAGLEELVLHPGNPVPTAFRWMLFAGLALNLLSVVASIGRAFKALAVERLVAVGVLGVLVAVSGGIDGLVVLVVVDVILAAALFLEHFRVEAPFRSEMVAA